jgi:hypothetical protein
VVHGAAGLAAGVEIDDHQHQVVAARGQRGLGVDHAIVHAGHGAQEHAIVEPVQHRTAIVVLRDAVT